MNFKPFRSPDKVFIALQMWLHLSKIANTNYMMPHHLMQKNNLALPYLISLKLTLIKMLIRKTQMQSDCF